MNTFDEFVEKAKKEAEEKVVNHWGIWVDKDTPITGVIHNCSRDWLINEDFFDGIDLSYEEFLSTNPTEEEIESYESFGSSTVLVGSWKKDEKGLYEPDKENGDYAGIMGEVYTQVVWSKQTTRCALCSPCYPGQGDLDSKGEFLTYTLPD